MSEREDGQTFVGPVEYVAGNDVNVTQYLNSLGPELTPSQRWELNILVNKLNQDYGEPPKDTWMYVHDAIGLKNIEAYRLAHFRTAKEILTLLLERAEFQQQSHDPIDVAELQQGQQRLQDECQRLKALVTHERQLNEQNVRELLQHQRQIDAVSKQRDGSLRAQLELKHNVSGLVAELATSREVASKALRAKNAWRIGLFLVLTLSGGGVGLQKQLYAESITQERSRLTVCEYAGSPYSWGSRIKTATGTQKCVKSHTGQYLWQPSK
ncbi:hypothetical protein [Aeromonas hydrophila]|uniref:hypothetical protein n=1 Tax=Aeromonas hydrophila TaxID=644 RepID=UPI00057557CA|nr:hypothetical protein [Aeromonas hydrophila]KHN59604.1 hypothetical protein OI72_05515 [Aeromonas hydrophila]OFC44872.1 hypothetical protein BA189_17380 [Aeromonas hydrophila]OFC51576.1 hypothetical protein BA188_15615 [Aeromonas hydrophila]